MADMTVDAAYVALREILGNDRWIQIEISDHPPKPRHYLIRAYAVPRQGERLTSLRECVRRIREWDKERHSDV